MSAMRDVLPAVYVKPCSTCKPGPDGSWTGAGWALTIIGACVVLVGFGIAITGSRFGAGSHSADGPPAPVMDAVQREDVERRAAAETQSDTAFTPNEKAGWRIAGLGLAPLIFGLIVLGFGSSRISDDKGQLRLAATNLVAQAVDGPAVCRQTAVEESRIMQQQQTGSGSGSGLYAPSAADCEGSPRHYAQSIDGVDSDPGVYLTVDYVYSTSFSTNGEITINDKLNHRALCVRVPDTDVAAAARASATPGTGGYGGGPTDAYPEFNDVSVDPDPYITWGACPDAPIG